MNKLLAIILSLSIILSTNLANAVRNEIGFKTRVGGDAYTRKLREDTLKASENILNAQKESNKQQEDNGKAIKQVSQNIRKMNLVSEERSIETNKLLDQQNELLEELIQLLKDQNITQNKILREQERSRLNKN